ncbi:MAG: DUF4118 domain-containing protein [Clostridia bacterium]|nr:DUF4118 domain-containing protein [Clostridia bacterium]
MKKWMINTGKTLGLLLGAILAGLVLYQNSHGQIELSMVFFLTVILIAQVTPGYGYGIAASLISVFCVNYFFTPPLYRLNFSVQGYPMMFAAMLIGSIIISTLTTKIKLQAEAAEIRERNTKSLYQENLRLERERDKIKMEAEQEAARGILLRAVSHDLRTPLTAIWGASSALLENWEGLETAQQKKLIKDIQTDSQWLIRMVENLLSVTRIQDGVTKLKKKPEVVEELAADAVQKMKQRFGSVSITLSLPEQFFMVHMDSMLIEQVLINLMENVIRHSGKPDRIGLTIREEKPWAVFEVEDWGKGIPQDGQLPEISGLPGDTVRDPGIGLRVCMTIVQAHGGQMTAFNKPEGGAVFRFTLPVEQEQNESYDK